MFYAKIKNVVVLTIISSIALLPVMATAVDELNIYSARKEALIKPVLDKFSKQTGIKINLITAKADALLKRIQSEGQNTHADIFITTDAGRLYRAKQAGVLQAFQSDILNQAIPENLRDPEGFWYGLTVRARPIFYVKEVMSSEKLSSYEDLAKPQYKNKICIRSSNNVYNQSLVASLLAANGKEKTQQWANDFVKNFARKPKGGDRDQIKAAASGQCDLAIANTYYFAKMVNSNKQDQKKAAAAVEIFWPNQNDRGAHINISGITITKHAKHVKAAKKLVEFLVSKESQRWYADVNYEYPVRSDIVPNKILASWGSFKSDTINLDQLGKNNAEAVKIMDRAGWK
jgi:iron(III) transport system substrate-binding protein